MLRADIADKRRKRRKIRAMVELFLQGSAPRCFLLHITTTVEFGGVLDNIDKTVGSFSKSYKPEKILQMRKE